MKAKQLFLESVYVLGGFFGLLLLLVGVVYTLVLGAGLRLCRQEPPVPLQVTPETALADVPEGALLELHGALQSQQMLQIPEYGISMNAACLVVEARVAVAAENKEDLASFYFHPLQDSEPLGMSCPTRELSSESLRIGNFPVSSSLISRLLHDRSRAGWICERSFLPLPLEHIHLPEDIRSMARVLPEKQRVDRPDCTILRLAERYRNAAEPLGELQEGDVELRFSYLPVDFPVAVRGRFRAGEIAFTCSSECAFAAGNAVCPVELDIMTDVARRTSVSSYFKQALVAFLLIWAGVGLPVLALRHLVRRGWGFRLPRILLTALVLQLVCLGIGCFLCGF
ncbi:MAG: hypothetical protein UHH87_02630 [Akkermansia sp.]|nr:hypothetical protein [Akkermansia sp.]